MPEPTSLKRESAGSYRSSDGRFTVQQASGGWVVVDGEQQDDLGLPLVRGPFGTLAEAKAGITAARSGPAPESRLAARRAAGGRRAGRSVGTGRSVGGAASRGGRAGREATSGPSSPPPPPPIEVRRYMPGDGPALRSFWAGIGLRSLGDDDESLDRLAARNPGLVLVATQGDRVVGTALGAWDGRRGWIYHVGTADDRRRRGLGRRLVQEVERKLRQLGCPKVNVIVRDENPDGARFWEALGYASPPARQFGKEL